MIMILPIIDFWPVIILQEAAEDLAPRLEPILQHLMYAFGIYQVGNETQDLGVYAWLTHLQRTWIYF